MIDSNDKYVAIVRVLLNRVENYPDKKLPLHTLHTGRLYLKSIFNKYLSPVPSDYKFISDELVPLNKSHKSGLV